MTGQVKVFMLAHLPADQANAFMQHIRDFDTAHPDCHFEIAADVPDTPLAEVLEMLRVNPAMTFTDVYGRKP